jgi:hypothetical protein
VIPLVVLLQGKKPGHNRRGMQRRPELAKLGRIHL